MNYRIKKNIYLYYLTTKYFYLIDYFQLKSIDIYFQNMSTSIKYRQKQSILFYKQVLVLLYYILFYFILPNNIFMEYVKQLFLQ